MSREKNSPRDKVLVLTPNIYSGRRNIRSLGLWLEQHFYRQIIQEEEGEEEQSEEESEEEEEEEKQIK